MNLDKFKSFDKKDKRLDDFYFHELGIQKYKELVYIVKIILTLSHGQVAVERGFSVRRQNEMSILNVNMSAESIVSKKIVRYHMISHSVKLHNFQISW